MEDRGKYKDNVQLWSRLEAVEERVVYNVAFCFMKINLLIFLNKSSCTLICLS